MNKTNRTEISSCEIAAWLIAGGALLFTLKLHLLPALLGGLLVYDLVHIISPKLHVTRIYGTRAKVAVVALLAFLIVLLLVIGIWGITVFLKNDSGSVPALLHKMAEIIESSRKMLPEGAAAYLPGDADDIKNRLVSWLHEHAHELQVMGKEAGLIVAHTVIGMVIGAMVSVREATPAHEYRPLAKALAERAARLSQAFRAIVFAQVRISALNTFFSWLYLGVLLPMLGVHLPLVKSMIAITFVAGLIPVIGNLISNAVIVVVSLSYSPAAALASLAFLVVIHKLEYFMNARIVGAQINAQAWELLLVIVVMETAFGVQGVIAAPIYYAYLKRELTDVGLV